MNNLYHAGFFIGFGEGIAKAYQEGAVEAYFRDGRTENGVEGCKLGWDYVEHLNDNLPFGEVDRILESFDKHILITRRDKVSQAVSRLIARQTGQWTSLDKRLDVTPVYDRSRLDYFIADAAGKEASVMAWLSMRGIRPLQMSYEENQKSWDTAALNVLMHIDVSADVPRITPTLQRQEDPLKREWKERYLKGK